MTDVDGYADGLAPDARAAFDALRRIIHEVVPGVAETIRYQMPCFATAGRYIVHVGAWKRHLGLYPVPTLSPDLEAAIAGHRAATDTVKSMYRTSIPDDILRQLIIELAARLPSS